MAKWRALLVLMAIIAIASSCEEKTGSEAFLAPTIVSANANAGIASVTFSCTLSAPRAQECGFVYWSVKNSEKTILCKLQGASFEASVSGLSSEKNYHWYAFAKAGTSEVRSDIGMFSPMEIPPPPTPPEVMIDIPDKVFKEYLTAHYDTDGDGEISESEALKVRKIAVKTDNILSLEGIEYFTNLDSLICRGVELDMNEHAEIGTPGRLTSLDLSKNTFLSHLECDANHLKELILPDNPWMVFLRCSHNYLTELDLSKLSGLEVLKAFNNQLTAIDVSHNPFLRTIELHNNYIESIDVTCCPVVDCLNIGNNKVKEVDLSKCPNLYWLGVFRSGITSVDLSACTNLHYLNCYEAPISSLDLTPYPSLYELRCYDCQITELDISMLPNLEIVDCAPMGSLKTLFVSDSQQIEGINVNRSEENVPAATRIVILHNGEPEEIITVKDTKFKSYLVNNFDTDEDGEISISEALRVRKIEVVTDDIFSLEGIEYFTKLDTLICRGVDPERNEYDYNGRPGRLRALDLSANIYLKRLECDGNYLETLILPDSPYLEFVRCSRNKLKELNLSLSPELVYLQAFDNNLTSLDVTSNPNLTHIELGTNPIESLDVSVCQNLELLNIGSSQIKEIDLSGCPSLGWLSISETDVETLDLSNNPNLDFLYCQNTGISSLDLSCCPKLYTFCCDKCLFEELDISMLSKLVFFTCAPMPTLKKLYVSDTQSIEGVTYNRSEIHVPAHTEIITRYSGAPDGKIVFEDPAFKSYLIGRFDIDKDGEISIEEAAAIYKIDICSNDYNIISLQGIEYMPNLTFLRCYGIWIDNPVINLKYYYISKNYHWDYAVGPVGTLKKVDVSHNPKLVILDLINNSGIGETGIGTLDLSNNPELEELYLQFCYIKYPDVSNCTKLQRLDLSHGHGRVPDFSKNTELRLLVINFEQRSNLQAIDVSNCPLLEELDVSANATSLSDLSFNPNLKSLKINWCTDAKWDLSAVPLLETYECKGNELKSLDLSAQKSLKQLSVSDNPLYNLDVSMCPNLWGLYCSNTHLSELNLSNNTVLEELDCSSNSLETLDTSNNSMIRWLVCGNNLIETLDVSKNRHLSGPNDNITGLFCAPMDDKDGNNILKTLHVSAGQSIEGVTVNRSTEHIPAKTDIVVK